MAKHLHITNEYGKVQLTDEASSYFFLREVAPLSRYYWSTSEKCDVTWSDGVKTTVAYNYCVNHGLSDKLVFVIRNPNDTAVRLAVAPLDFAGNPSFHVSVTGCTKAQADALRVYIFSGEVSEFTDGKCGMAFYDANGYPLYNSSWKPLKIIGYGAKDGAWNESISYNANCGVILNSGYRSANSTTVTTGHWTTLTTNSQTSAPSYVFDGSAMTFNPPIFISGGSYNSNYSNSGQSINTFPTDITYQGYVLAKSSLTARTYTAKAPIASLSNTRSWTETTQEYQMVRRWDDCAISNSSWDPCATTTLTWDPCASQDFFTGECQAGLVNKCQAGLVNKCQAGYVTSCVGGWKDDWEWVTVTTDYTETTIDVYPYMDSPSLMYGMEAYPDGTIFTRSSGTSTVGVVELANYL